MELTCPGLLAEPRQRPRFVQCGGFGRVCAGPRPLRAKPRCHDDDAQPVGVRLASWSVFGPSRLMVTLTGNGCRRALVRSTRAGAAGAAHRGGRGLPVAASRSAGVNRLATPAAVELARARDPNMISLRYCRTGCAGFIASHQGRVARAPRASFSFARLRPAGAGRPLLLSALLSPPSPA